MSEPLTDERLDALEAEWGDAWDGLDDTPMMPTSKADPAYGGREHRMIASAPRTILALIAEVRALRRVGERMAEVLEANRRDVAFANEMIVNRVWHGHEFTQAIKEIDEALAEWRRVRGGEGASDAHTP